MGGRHKRFNFPWEVEEEKGYHLTDSKAKE
jgi:hypothetical protein